MNLSKISKFKLGLVTFLTAFALRLSVVFGYIFGFFNGGLEGGDTHLYIEIANNLLSGNGFAADSAPTAYVSPFFPIFLTAIFSIFGENLILISVIQSILSALVCVFIYYYTVLIFENVFTGFLAGIISAFNYELILWANAQILTEPLYIFLFATAILFLVSALKKAEKATLYFVISGLFFALASLTRPILIAVTFGIFVLIFISSFFRNSINWKRTLYFFAVFLLMLMPWGIRNYFVMGNFTVMSLEGGYVFWLGNNPQYDRYEHPDFHKFGGYTAIIKPDEELAKKMTYKTSAEKNKIFSQAAWQHIKNHPADFIKRALHKNWNMWRPNFSNSSWRNNLISYTFYPLILITSLVGMFLAWRNSNENFLKKIGQPIGIFIAIFLMHIFIHSVITGEIRFRVPLWIILIPFSAFTFSKILEKTKLAQITY
ncbi:MAG: ArnT family glycosyltransferase [Aridibacter sp.]